MKVLINGQILEMSYDSATQRYYKTFVADSTTTNLSVISECSGDTVLRDIQIEEGAVATPYVVPEIQRGVISGIFSNLKQINLEMTDQANSKLWSAIKISTQGTLEKYHKDNISTEIARTAEGIRSIVSGDGEGSVNSRITQLRNLIDQRVSVDGLSGVIRNSGDNIMVAIADKGKGIKTAINLDSSDVRIKGDKIHLDGSVFTDNFTAAVARIIKLNADSITTGELNANKVNIVGLNANKIVGLDADFIKARIELAMIDWLKGKTIEAQNGNMRIDLNKSHIHMLRDGAIQFHSGDNTIFRENGAYRNGKRLNTAFLHFNETSSGGLYASLGVTSAFEGVNSASSGGFAGIRVFRQSNSGFGISHPLIDRTEVYGDKVVIRHDFVKSGGFTFNVSDLDNENIDMNKMFKAVRALGRIISHLANVRWNTQDQAFVNAAWSEYNNHIRGF